MSGTAIESESSNHTCHAARANRSSGPGAFVVRIGFLLGMIAAFVEGFQRKSDLGLQHARWGARW